MSPSAKRAASASASVMLAVVALGCGPTTSEQARQVCGAGRVAAVDENANTFECVKAVLPSTERERLALEVAELLYDRLGSRLGDPERPKFMDCDGYEASKFLTVAYAIFEVFAEPAPASPVPVGEQWRVLDCEGDVVEEGLSEAAARELVAHADEVGSGGGPLLDRLPLRAVPVGDEHEEAHLAAVVAMHRRELLAFGQYAAIVHPEDLPVDYRPGMKLVEWAPAVPVGGDGLVELLTSEQTRAFAIATLDEWDRSQKQHLSSIAGVRLNNDLMADFLLKRLAARLSSTRKETPDAR